jgi:hypothetical protein
VTNNHAEALDRFGGSAFPADVEHDVHIHRICVGFPQDSEFAEGASLHDPRDVDLGLRPDAPAESSISLSTWA